MVANYDQSQTPEAIESLRDMARRFAIEAERIDIDCTPMVIAIDELRLARAGAVRTEEFRASLDAVEVVLGRMLYRSIAQMPIDEVDAAVEKLIVEDKRTQDREIRYAEFCKLMRDDPEFQAKQHGARAKQLNVSISTIDRDFRRWKKEQNITTPHEGL